MRKEEKQRQGRKEKICTTEGRVPENRDEKALLNELCRRKQ